MITQDFDRQGNSLKNSSDEVRENKVTIPITIQYLLTFLLLIFLCYEAHETFHLSVLFLLPFMDSWLFESGPGDEYLSLLGVPVIVPAVDLAAMVYLIFWVIKFCARM